MSITGIVLVILLSMSLFAANNVEANIVPKSKHSVKNDLKELKSTFGDKSIKITKISKSRTLHIWHIVEVQVCAGADKLYSPDLELRSDRDLIQVTLWGLIMPNSCKSGQFFIAADDPNSISVNFSSQTHREPTSNSKSPIGNKSR